MRDKLRRTQALAALSLLLAVPLAGCQPETPEVFEHGVVYLKMLRGAAASDTPYSGTATIEVTLLYRECLTSFYEANPDYEQYGVEGALVFGSREEGGEGWLDLLCDGDNPAAVDCTVEEFRQELDMTKQLTVTYAVGGTDIENRELPFGPIPKAGLAACEAGGQPIVRVGAGGAVRGIDGEGDTIWNAESFDPTEAATDQGQAIEIRATRI